MKRVKGGNQPPQVTEEPGCFKKLWVGFRDLRVGDLIVGDHWLGDNLPEPEDIQFGCNVYNGTTDEYFSYPAFVIGTTEIPNNMPWAGVIHIPCGDVGINIHDDRFLILRPRT